MPTEPTTKRAITFFDGQNLYHSAKAAFGHTFPNYDVRKLSMAICAVKGWEFVQARFYTGVPDMADDAHWHRFWEAKLLQMSRQNVHVFTRSLRYRNQRVSLPDGSRQTIMVAEEKGIDVRIAIDVIRMAHHREYDVALVFSQDQDLSEVADEVRVISKEQDRWIKMASAYPVSPVIKKQRGINRTDWVPVERKVYDTCLDLRDYRRAAAAARDPEREHEQG